MTITPLPHHATLPEDERQAAALLDISDAEARAVPLTPDDLRLAVARAYDFADWARLAEHVAQASTAGTPVARFEAAVNAVVAGDLAALGSLLGEHPDLVRARSARVTPCDPPVHRATLLHYVAANGVEAFRQKTPPNAVEVARALLDAGAEVDALADLYGGRCTTLTLLVSSGHPAAAGLQAALVDVLADHGAVVEPLGAGRWASPLSTALAFGYVDTAEALVRRGARVDTLAAAAGLGRVDVARRLLDAAAPDERHRALALSAQNGRAETVRLMLDAGEDPDRHNPDGCHGHATPLHQAVLAGHDAVVRLLVGRGARLDLRDTIWHGTPLGWAKHGGQPAIAEYLAARGARDD